jgi:hypothetical protein
VATTVICRSLFLITDFHGGNHNICQIVLILFIFKD